MTRCQPRRSGSLVVVVGVRISLPERLIYPDQEIFKLHLARHHESIADWIVPHDKGRPLTLARRQLLSPACCLN